MYICSCINHRTENLASAKRGHQTVYTSLGQEESPDSQTAEYVFTSKLSLELVDPENMEPLLTYVSSYRIHHLCVDMLWN